MPRLPGNASPAKPSKAPKPKPMPKPMPKPKKNENAKSTKPKAKGRTRKTMRGGEGETIKFDGYKEEIDSGTEDIIEGFPIISAPHRLMIYVEGCALPHQTSTWYRYLKFQLTHPQVIAKRELICYLTREPISNPKIFAFFSNSKVVYKDQFVTLGDLLDGDQDPFVQLYLKAKIGFLRNGRQESQIPGSELNKYNSLSERSEISDFIRRMNRYPNDLVKFQENMRGAPSREAIRAWVIATPLRTYYQNPRDDWSPEKITNAIIRMERLNFNQYDES